MLIIAEVNGDATKVDRVTELLNGLVSEIFTDQQRSTTEKQDL